MTILVVVRDADVRALISDMLKQEQWRILSAASAEEAVDVSAETEVDLLIAELAPAVDGRSLAQRMRQQTPGLAVLYVTGWYDDADFVGLKDETLLTTPFTRHELMDAIGAVFAHERES